MGRGITFKSENGCCPYFIYKKIRFFIQDEKQGSKYTYSLRSKDLKVTKHKFNSYEECKKYLESEKAVIKARYQDFDGYENRKNIFKVIKHKEHIEVQVFNVSVYESGNFDNYIDCLNWSKEHIGIIIKSSEPEQLMIPMRD